ncbi:MAG: 3',5'-cyclic AMP phosphodiesterase CpdA [Paraglaciecola sp.]|jgi:3',5'-cyclic AMP phosphodiesterase CpdA
MKNIFTTLLLLCIFTTISFAQNWSPVNLSDKYNFQNDTADHITNTIWVDSVEVQGLDSVFYLNRIVKPCPECPGASNYEFYYKAYQGQFLQKEIRKEGDDKYVFKGEHPFTIFPKANLNETWLMDTLNNTEATVSNIQEIQLFDNQYSIKTIVLSSGDSILLSKEHGVVYFPEIYEGSSFDLVGIEGRDLGGVGAELS